MRQGIKRAIIIGLGVCLAFVLAGCDAASLSQEGLDRALTEQGVLMAQQIGRMAKDEVYTSLMSMPPEIDKIFSVMGQADYSTPKAVYCLSFSGEQALARWLKMKGETAELSLETKEALGRRFLNMIPTQLNGRGGSEVLTATSIVSAQSSFVQTSLTESALYFFHYDGDWSVVVSYLPGMDGAVVASAMFLGSEALAETVDPQGSADLFGEMLGITPDDIRKVS